ncbi:MAG: glycogen debranching enzyme family protein [Chitinophagales bacterium]|nr:glycogen debranching enzyme family protein [Chitinophagales bacterium]
MSIISLQKDKSFLSNYDNSVSCEWLETNGLGGYASSTLSCCNTRRYHGLLVAALVPPAERYVLVNKMDEVIVIRDVRHELGCNNYGDVITPQGFTLMDEFRKELFPHFYFNAGGVQIKKTVAMVHSENTTVILYEVLEAPIECMMEFVPFISARGYHELSHANETINKDVDFQNGTLRIKAYETSPEIYISISGASFQHHPVWYYNFTYAEEKARGQDDREDLFNPGTFQVQLKKGDIIEIILSTENPEERNSIDLLKQEERRRKRLLVSQPNNKVSRLLALAADQFIVRREATYLSVIAGYPWFTDWSRDTMIALPGLCLATGRFDDAKKILASYANHVSRGMLPNRFQDHNLPLEYNNVDGTLWYFIAVYKYLIATGDKKFVLREMLPVLHNIIDWHFHGTQYQIKADSDGLLFAGEPGIQLTWMDAKAGDWVVTPRIGKPVEVNALWYNALRIYAAVLKLNGTGKLAKQMKEKAKQVRKNFVTQFWNADLQYLYDVVKGDEKDSALRPNQLLALGLCFPLIKGQKAEAILKVIKDKLLTPVGLRTLSPDHTSYKGTYSGNLEERDGAYHQGTVWSWLFGPYLEALIRIYDTEGKKEACQIIQNFTLHLNQAGMGTISEIFDGDAPHMQRGCIAQAWSVGELLRVINEYRLYKYL